MSKDIVAKIDEYEKDGETKGRYTKIGVILSNENGEYILMDPTVNLAGVLMKQRVLAQKQGKKGGDSVICSIFDRNENQGGSVSNSGGNEKDWEDTDGDSIPF